MKSSNPLVIVLSRNYSTGLGVVRSLGVAGYTVDLIASVKKRGSSVIISSSKYIRNSVEVLDTKIQGSNGQGVVDEIMKYANAEYENKPILFPADDFTASIVSNNYDLFDDYFLMPRIENGDYSLNDTMDKVYQSSLAKQFGIPVAREWVIDLNGEIVVPSDVVYPCYVKPCKSVDGSKAEMTSCNSADELLLHLKSMKTFYSSRTVVVQEYLKIDKEYDLSGVCLNRQIIIPAVIEKTRIAKFEPGVTMSGKMLEIDELGEAKEKIIAMLTALGYFGMFDMELFKCGDKIYFNEINLRSGGPNYAYYLNGVNLPDIFVKALLGKGHNAQEEVLKSYGKTFVYEKVAWEDYIHSFITKKELKKCIDDADYTLLADENDSAPGDCFFRRIRLSAIKHKVMIALGKEK